MTCPLCVRQPLRKVYHESPRWWVTECLTCRVPLIVFKDHISDPPDWVRREGRELSERLFPDRRYDDVMRALPDHYHGHAR